MLIYDVCVVVFVLGDFEPSLYKAIFSAANFVKIWKTELNKIMHHVWSSAHSNSICRLVWIVFLCSVSCAKQGDKKSQECGLGGEELCEKIPEKGEQNLLVSWIDGKSVKTI